MQLFGLTLADWSAWAGIVSGAVAVGAVLIKLVEVILRTRRKKNESPEEQTSIVASVAHKIDSFLQSNEEIGVAYSILSWILKFIVKMMLLYAFFVAFIYIIFLFYKGLFYLATG